MVAAQARAMEASPSAPKLVKPIKQYGVIRKSQTPIVPTEGVAVGTIIPVVEGGEREPATGIEVQTIKTGTQLQPGGDLKEVTGFDSTLEPSDPALLGVTTGVHKG